MLELTPILIKSHESLRTGLERMNRSGRTVLLLVNDQGQLLQTVTDGDLRRVILDGGDLESRLHELPERSSWTVPEGTPSEEVLALMNRHRIDQVPVVDSNGRPVDLHLRRELDQPILLSTPHLSEYEREYVEQAFASNWIAPIGPNLDAFERELAAEVGSAHAAALSSGTAAIHLGLQLLGVGEGDIVFTSSLTFVATANPILYLGAEPVFIDSEPETWNMSPVALERALRDADRRGRLPKVVMPVGLYGQSPDMQPILELCNRYDIPVLEDAAESLGAQYNGRQAGTFGRLGVYSFNGNKIITTSGGGMLVSDNEDMIQKARFLATQARDSAPHYQHSMLGFNYRMSNILAGVGRGQLRVLSDRIEQRRSVFQRYLLGLDHIEGIDWMPEPQGHHATRWLTAARIDPTRTGVEPCTIIERLAAARIEARPVWKPMHLQPLFNGRAYWPHHECESVSEDLFKHGLCLPSGSNLAPEAQRRVIDELVDLFAQANPKHRAPRPNSLAG